MVDPAADWTDDWRVFAHRVRLDAADLRWGQSGQADAARRSAEPMSRPGSGETPRASEAASLLPRSVTDSASSRWGTPVQLVGRDLEIGIIRAFVDRAYGDGGAFLISGDAGVGKSALIGAAVAYAASIGFMVLRATGAEFEAHVSFAGLHQLLYPLMKNVDQLDELQRRALDSAFGLRQGAAGPDDHLPCCPRIAGPIDCHRCHPHRGRRHAVAGPGQCDDSGVRGPADSGHPDRVSCRGPNR